MELCIDLETTGLEIWRDKIVQIGLAYGGHRKSILINPGVPIPSESSYIHNITDDVVMDCKPFSHYAGSIHRLMTLADCYVGYNIRKFDIPFLQCEMLRCGYEIPNKPIIDVYEMVNSFEPDKRLSSVYLRYFSEKLVGSHNALTDVDATLRILEHLRGKLS